MNKKGFPRRLMLGLVAAMIVLPIAILLFWALGLLLPALGDPAGGRVLKYLALAGGIVWVFDLICLVLLQAIASLFDSDEH